MNERAVEQDARALALLRRFGRDAMSFVALESGMRHWFDDASEAFVAYFEAGDAWVACGAPVADPLEIDVVATRFVDAARRRGRRASFFATEWLPARTSEFRAMLLGEQPVLATADWEPRLAKNRGLREQLRRARAKDVRVRRLESAEIHGALLKDIERLAAGWLASRSIEPMRFVVAVEPFSCAPEHRYFVAEKDAHAVAFLSAIPIFARASWMVEDVFRDRSAPNGTSELLIDALVRDVAARSDSITLGLAPLSGDVTAWLRVARVFLRPLYDFQGLRAFRARLRPTRWERVYLVHPRARSPIFQPFAPLVAIFDALRAFAGGAILPFAVRSLARHPSGPPLVLAAPLAPWTLLLLVLTLTHHAATLGFTNDALLRWTVFDALLFLLLVECARRPVPSRLGLATIIAAFDAVLSALHLATKGIGDSTAAIPLRLLATLGPSFGAFALALATFTSFRARKH